MSITVLINRLNIPNVMGPPPVASLPSIALPNVDTQPMPHEAMLRIRRASPPQSRKRAALCILVHPRTWFVV